MDWHCVSYSIDGEPEPKKGKGFLFEKQKPKKLQGLLGRKEKWAISNPSCWSSTWKFQSLILMRKHKKQSNNVMVVVEPKRALVNYRKMSAKLSSMTQFNHADIKEAA